MKYGRTLFAILTTCLVDVAANATAAPSSQQPSHACIEARRIASGIEGNFIKEGLISRIEADVVEVTPKWTGAPFLRQTQWLTDIAVALYAPVEPCADSSTPHIGRPTRILAVQLGPNPSLLGTVTATTVADDSPVSTFVEWTEWYWAERVRAEVRNR